MGQFPADFGKVNLTKYVHLGNRQWRFCPVVRSANGRVKQDHVFANGRTEIHPEGTYYLDWYEGGMRKRRSVGKAAVDAHAAEMRQAQLLANHALGIQVVGDQQDGTNRVTLVAACAEFLEETRSKRPKTYEQYRLALEYFQQSCGTETRLKQIARKDLLRFIIFLREQKHLSQRTSWTKLNVAVQMLKVNGIAGLLRRHDWPRYVEAEPEAYGREELDRFLSACRPADKVLFEFFWMTGFRDTEVQHVCRRDLDLKQQVVRIEEKPQWNFVPKNWERREVPIPDRLVGSLQRWLATRVIQTELLFPTAGGQPNYHFLPRCKRIAYEAGLNCGHCGKHQRSCAKGAYCAHWYLHKFRATFATMHLQNGVDLRTVQLWMGHKDLSSTLRYLQPARGRAVLEKVNHTFGAA